MDQQGDMLLSVMDTTITVNFILTGDGEALKMVISP